MAYGGNVELGWVEAWNNGYYKVSNYLYYKQDLQNRKILVGISNQQCCSLNSAYTFHNDVGVNNGYGFNTYGGPVVDVADPVYVPGGGCWTHSGDRLCEREFNYNDDGSLPDINISTQFIAGINQYNTPEFDWNTRNYKDRFPTMSAKVGVPSFTAGMYSNMVTVSWDLVTNGTDYQIEYLKDDGKTVTKMSTTSPISSSKTEFTGNTLKVRIRAVDQYGNWGNWSEYKSVSLNPIIAPSGIEVSNITSDSALVTWDAVENAVKYKVVIGDNNYIKSGTGVVVTGLTPETEYTVTVTAYDANSNFATSDEAIFTTDIAQLRVLINKNGTKKIGLLNLKVGDEQVKVKTAYVKVNGVKKKVVTFKDA